ncbi:MAG: hypothetical protein GKR88_21300 [Flavobacteriaceae bacterium]|nr:MAG: hypothetical protein GKR88_21300 [Flavobacteriaceae bacterium]
MERIIVLLLIVSVLFYSCQIERNRPLNDALKEKIVRYIKVNPIKDINRKVYNKEIPYPSYHIYFDTIKNDTLIAIKLLPHLSSFNLLQSLKSNDSVQVFEEIKPLGYFFIDNSPVVIFDPNNYSEKLINRKNLKRIIPDSLQFEIGKINYHIKNYTKYYKFSKGKFIEIDDY